MRQVYLDSDEDNEIYKISFYSASSGYVAFWDWIGFTTDTGHNFIKKYITLSNVDYNGYGVNLTFGFYINGVHAFNQNSFLAYGHYGLVPSILSSTDGGNTFKLIYHSQFSPTQLSGGITDMIFPENNLDGFAIDADRVLKTTNGGNSWTVSKVDPGAFWTNLEGVNRNNIFVFSNEYTTNRLMKTTNGGSSWQNMVLPSLPEGKMTYAHFRTATKGWLSMYDNNSNEYFYTTSNGGSNWTLQNDLNATPFSCGKMKFFDDNTGYALSGQNTVYKTFDGGRIWEPLPRDNNFVYLGYSHNDLHFWNQDQLWAGGGHGFLELSTNGGGTPLPRAYFKIDTAGVAATGNVNLLNFSKTSHTFQWFVNDVPVSTSYNATYVHDIYHTIDTIKLVATSGTNTDTSIKYSYFHPPVVVSSFTPASGAGGTIVNIMGLNFTGATSVTFGGVPAGFTVLSSTSIRATVGSGASGSVKVSTPTGSGSLPGFTFIPPPTITSFTPTSAAAGTTVTITGTNFINVTTVSFGGTNASSYTVVSPTTITAAVPSGASGNVGVVAIGGAAAVPGYTSLPTITSFTPTQGTQGTILDITGTSFPEVNVVTVGGVPVQSFTITPPNTIRAIVSTGASGSVVVSKPAGSSTLAGFTWYPPPVITSFTPQSGPVGTTVTITGNNFHATPANNIVYFGDVRAIVTAGTTTSLTVTVPVGASYKPITVLSNRLIAYSDKPFQVTFPDGGAISANSFANPAVINMGSTNGPTQVNLGDLDGDGKTDMIISKYGFLAINSGVALFRNTSTTTTISFDTPVNLENMDYKAAGLGDIDGDGQLDLAVLNENKISLFRNTSVPGTISFVASGELQARNDPTGIVLDDVDGDGKADIVVSGASVFRNTSDPGNLRFAARIDYDVSGGRNVAVADMDGDSKPELIVPNATNPYFHILKNNCTVGNISFAPAQSYLSYTHSNLAVCDMDGDGKADIVVGSHTGSKMSIHRNTSSVGSISLAPVIEFPATSTPQGLGISDLDGDGKLDVATALINNSLGVYKNASTPGNISLIPKVDYLPGFYNGQHMLGIGDINGDGKDDVVVSSETLRSLYIHINNVQPEPFIQSFTPTIGEAGTVVTITGNNFTGTTAVSFGGVPAASFTVNSSTSITAVVGSGGSGAVSVTNSYGPNSLASFVYGIPPAITSVTPLTGPVGSSVTITGTRFNPAIAGNTVYFGGVKAVVTAASSTSITVTVPGGATHQPISVNTNNLVAYSPAPFIVTFPGGGSGFTNASFDPYVSRSGGYGTACDMDDDGKLDIVQITTGNNVSVGRNTGTPGTISFAANVSFPTNAQPNGVITGDLDGDTKPDVVTWNYDSQSFSVLRNMTTAAGILLSAPAVYQTGPSTTRPIDAAIMDLDLDGKPEIMVANYYTGTVSVYRNLSTVGNIVLDTRIDYLMVAYSQGIAAADIDGDGKPELIASVNGQDGVSVFRNTSVPGSISFATKIDYPAGAWPSGMNTGDLDRDGKIDIAFANLNSNTISVMRNTSAVGSITFNARQDFSNDANRVCLGDLDGDGKPDIVGQNGASIVSVFKNTSIPGSVTMAANVDYPVASFAWTGMAGDFDNDGVPDLVAFTGGGGTCLLRNRIGGFAVASPCVGTSATITSSVSGTTYQWQQDTGSGFVNISDNSSFSGTSTVALVINNVQAAWNDYKYRCIVNGVEATTVYTLRPRAAVVPSVTISTASTSICTGASVTFTATPANGGATPVYQWQLNGSNVSINSPTYSNSTLTNNAEVKCIMTSNASCAVPSSATSNTITMTVNPRVTPSVSVSASATTICTGTNVIFTATPVNGGTSPSYQWKLNGANVGTNSATYSNNTLNNGDVVQVVMTSNATCATPAITGSSNITITVTGTVTPSVTISTPSTSVCSGANVIFTALPVNGGASPVYQWKLNGVNTGTNSATYASTSLNNNDVVSVQLTSSSGCAVPSTATSNTISMNVTASLQPSITISGTTTVTQGQSVLLSSGITNGGNAPVYQWQDSTNTHNWQDIAGATSTSLSYTPVLTGDKVRCRLVSNQSCASPTPVLSNALPFIVNVVTAVDPQPGDRVGIRSYPNPVTTTLTIDTLKLSDKWQSVTITGTDGRSQLRIKNIANQTRIILDVSRFTAGLYIIELRRRSGQKVYLKFIKQ